MKLTFIGTSHGVPERDRRCSSCILEVDGCYYLFDMGTQVVEDLRRLGIPMDKVRLAICSHPHGDHTDGLISFVDLINWYFKSADPLVLLPDGRLIPPMTAWIEATSEGRPLRGDLRIGTFSEGVAYEDDRLRVTAIRTKHCGHSYAFLAEAEGKSILFTNDLCRPSEDFPQTPPGRGPDLIVCEAAHFSPDEYLPFFEKARPKRVLYSHVYVKRWGDVIARQTAQSRDYETGVAFDGLEVIV